MHEEYKIADILVSDLIFIRMIESYEKPHYR